MKLGDRVRIIRKTFGHPDLDPISGVIGEIISVDVPFEGDPKQRRRYDVHWSEPVGPRGYISHYPLYEEDLEAAPEWMRVRFHANLDDYRPVKWPPPGPYWCSGYGEDYSVVVAYVKSAGQVEEFWPEASDVDILNENTTIRFSDRFAKPKWWEDDQS